MGFGWQGSVSIAFTALAFVVMAADWVGRVGKGGLLGWGRVLKSQRFLAAACELYTAARCFVVTFLPTTQHFRLQVGPDVTFTVLLAFLTAFDGQIVTVAKAAAGYGNTGLLTVIFLYWVAEGITQTGGKTWIGVGGCGLGCLTWRELAERVPCAHIEHQPSRTARPLTPHVITLPFPLHHTGLELIMNFVLGRSRSVHWALARSMFPVMCLSAFLNNTPCVTFMIPSGLQWLKVRTVCCLPTSQPELETLLKLGTQ